MIKSLSYHCPGLFRTFPGRTSRKSVGQFGRRGYCREIAVPRFRELSRAAPHSRGCPGPNERQTTSLQRLLRGSSVFVLLLLLATARPRQSAFPTELMRCCCSSSCAPSRLLGCGILLVSLDTHSGYRFSLNLAAQLFGGLPRILLVGDSPVFCCCWHAAYTPPRAATHHCSRHTSVGRPGRGWRIARRTKTHTLTHTHSGGPTLGAELLSLCSVLALRTTGSRPDYGVGAKKLSRAKAVAKLFAGDQLASRTPPKMRRNGTAINQTSYPTNVAGRPSKQYWLFMGQDSLTHPQITPTRRYL